MNVTRNLIWVWYITDLANLPDNELFNVLSTLKNASFTDIAVPLNVRFNSSGDLVYSGAGGDYKTMFQRIANFVKQAGFRDLFTYMYTGGSSDVPRLDASMRNKMLAGLQTHLAGLPEATGHIDDLEMEYSVMGSEADYVAWVNSVADMCRGLGKFGGCYLMTPTYPYQSARLPMILPNLDVDAAVFDTNNPEYIEIMHEIGSCEWFPHLLTVGSGSESMASSLALWDNVISSYGGLPNRVIGFGVWCYPFITRNIGELEAWRNWKPKDIYVEPVPSPSPPPPYEEPEPTPTPEPTPQPPAKTIIARLIANPVILTNLRIMRNTMFTYEQHKKLHPLI